MKKKRSKISYREMLGGDAPAEPVSPSETPEAPAVPAVPEGLPAAAPTGRVPADTAPLLESDHPLSAEEIAARLNRRLTPGEGMAAIPGTSADVPVERTGGAAPPVPANPPAADAASPAPRPRLKRDGPKPRQAGAADSPSRPAGDSSTPPPPGVHTPVAAPATESAGVPPETPTPTSAEPPRDDEVAAAPDEHWYDPSIPLRERLRSGTGTVELLMFQVGPERFAASLASVEEVVETPDIHRLPEMPDSMLGVFELRQRLLPVYSPTRVLGTELARPPAATLVIRSSTGDGRIGLAVDDVEDVLVLAVTAVRDAPGTDDADGVLLGVTARGQNLVAIVDADALIAACVTEGITEFS